MDHRIAVRIVGACILAVLATGPSVWAASGESKRLDRARDLIADEQWSRAVVELKAAADDPKEPNRAEALFWLAHSQHQAHDLASAVATIRRLEREFPASVWVKPARSLRIEIAQRLQRNDVLWFNAAPPPPPAGPPPPGPVAMPVPPVPPAPRAPGERPPMPPRFPRAAAPDVPGPPPVPAALPAPPAAAAPPAPPAPPWPPAVWMPEHYFPDTDLRIQALGSLMSTDAARVIPMLKAIALENQKPGEARRALFVLAQSGRPEARTTVVEVAKTGPEVVRIAAVRELGRLHVPGIANELLQVYSNGNARVKFQVVTSLGERVAAQALMRIAQSETNRELRDTAIMALGLAGGQEQLRLLYARAGADAKRPIIAGLFNARAEEELIRIADRERDPAIRQDVLARLRLLGTPRARQYLERLKQK